MANLLYNVSIGETGYFNIIVVYVYYNVSNVF